MQDTNMQDWSPMVLNSKKSDAPEKVPQKNLTSELTLRRRLSEPVLLVVQRSQDRLA